MEIKVGLTKTIETVVNEGNVAARFNETLPKVFSTPDMIAEMEAACYLCLNEVLESGKASVGVHVNVSHDLAVPIGQKVKTTATIAEIDRRKIVFKVESIAEDGKSVGQGTHTRFVVDKTW